MCCINFAFRKIGVKSALIWFLGCCCIERLKSKRCMYTRGFSLRKCKVNAILVYRNDVHSSQKSWYSQLRWFHMIDYHVWFCVWDSGSIQRPKNLRTNLRTNCIQICVQNLCTPKTSLADEHFNRYNILGMTSQYIKTVTWKLGGNSCHTPAADVINKF